MHTQETLNILGTQHHIGSRGDMKLDSRQCGNDQSFLDRANDEFYRLSLLLFQCQLALTVSVPFYFCFFFIQDHQCILGVNVIESILKTQSSSLQPPLRFLHDTISGFSPRSMFSHHLQPRHAFQQMFLLSSCRLLFLQRLLLCTFGFFCYQVMTQSS